MVKTDEISLIRQEMEMTDPGYNMNNTPIPEITYFL